MWSAVVTATGSGESRDETDVWTVTTDRMDDPDHCCFFLFRNGPCPVNGDVVHVGSHIVFWGDTQARKHLNDFGLTTKDSP